VSGVKYTTARHTSERAIDAVFSALGRRSPTCRTADTPLLGAVLARGVDPATWEWEDQQLAPEAGERLLERYGDRWEEVVAAVGGPGEARPLSPGCPVLRTEVRFAVRHECAATLADIVLRRTGLGATGRPDRAALDACATLAGEELGWTAVRREEEIRAVNALYDPVDMVRAGVVGEA
jgi:glycerol-3-phosphate dehydrogenase